MTVFDPEEVEQHLDDDGKITGTVKLRLWDIVYVDAEGFFDLLSEALIGDDLLQDITCKVVGYEADNVIRIEVTGNPEESIKFTKLLELAAQEEANGRQSVQSTGQTAERSTSTEVSTGTPGRIDAPRDEGDPMA